MSTTGNTAEREEFERLKKILEEEHKRKQAKALASTSAAPAQDERDTTFPRLRFIIRESEQDSRYVVTSNFPSRLEMYITGFKEVPKPTWKDKRDLLWSFQAHQIADTLQTVQGDFWPSTGDSRPIVTWELLQRDAAHIDDWFAPVSEALGTLVEQYRRAHTSSQPTLDYQRDVKHGPSFLKQNRINFRSDVGHMWNAMLNEGDTYMASQSQRALQTDARADKELGLQDHRVDDSSDEIDITSPGCGAKLAGVFRTWTSTSRRLRTTAGLQQIIGYRMRLHGLLAKDDRSLEDKGEKLLKELENELKDSEQIREELSRRNHRAAKAIERVASDLARSVSTFTENDMSKVWAKLADKCETWEQFVEGSKEIFRGVPPGLLMDDPLLTDRWTDDGTATGESIHTSQRSLKKKKKKNKKRTTTATAGGSETDPASNISRPEASTDLEGSLQTVASEDTASASASAASIRPGDSLTAAKKKKKKNRKKQKGKALESQEDDGPDLNDPQDGRANALTGIGAGMIAEQPVVPTSGLAVFDPVLQAVAEEASSSTGQDSSESQAGSGIKPSVDQVPSWRKYSAPLPPAHPKEPAQTPWRAGRMSSAREIPWNAAEAMAGTKDRSTATSSQSKLTTTWRSPLVPTMSAWVPRSLREAPSQPQKPTSTDQVEIWNPSESIRKRAKMRADKEAMNPDETDTRGLAWDEYDESDEGDEKWMDQFLRELTGKRQLTEA